MACQISLDDVDEVNIEIRDLGVAVNTSPSLLDPASYSELFRQKFGNAKRQSYEKQLLGSVNASLRTGTLTAIIGGSGSGKTTLLNTLAERMPSPRLSKTGSITFNGCEGIQNVRHAYVMQQDVLQPTLTVRETLQHAADLRLPSFVLEKDRLTMVEEVILELGLKECADTRVGQREHGGGCSGGEKRRTSIGVQLLANPSLLFLDEPTTGLDATSAFQLVRTLKALTDKGRTILTTIHQPRSEIWDLFDNLIVLSKGSPVYSGPADKSLLWFESLGFELPPFVNPAEFVIDLSAIDNRSTQLEENSTSRVQKLKEAWRKKEEQSLGTTNPEKSNISLHVMRIPSQAPPTRASNLSRFLRQTKTLTARTFKVTHRDPMGMAASIMEAIVMGIVAGYIFFDIPRTQAGIKSRQGSLYTAAGLQGYLFLIFETYRLTVDMPTYDRENSEGCVDVVSFLLSRRLARLFTEDLPVPIIFTVIFYFMTGFERSLDKFFVFFTIVLINHYIAVICAQTCVASIRHFSGASLIANLVYTLQTMACGYFVQSNTIPVYIRWMKYITYNVSGMNTQALPV
jgi:ABC-type multidrug transport system ATPase subunit